MRIYSDRSPNAFWWALWLFAAGLMMSCGRQGGSPSETSHLTQGPGQSTTSERAESASGGGQGQGQAAPPAQGPEQGNAEATAQGKGQELAAVPARGLGVEQEPGAVPAQAVGRSKAPVASDQLPVLASCKKWRWAALQRASR